VIAAMLAWLIGPLLIGWALSVAFAPILWDRYLLGSAPAALLLLARGIAALPLPAPARAAAAGVLALSIAPAALDAAAARLGERHDMRAAGRLIEQQSRPGDRFVPVPSFVAIPIAYYVGGLESRLKVQHDRDPRVPAPDGRVWLVFAQAGLDSVGEVISAHQTAGYELVFRRDLHGAVVALMQPAT
jgi:hypothetical protein